MLARLPDPRARMPIPLEFVTFRAPSLNPPVLVAPFAVNSVVVLDVFAEFCTALEPSTMVPSGPVPDVASTRPGPASFATAAPASAAIPETSPLRPTCRRAIVRRPIAKSQAPACVR